LTQIEAAEEKRKVRIADQATTSSAEAAAKLPPRLIDLVEKSMRMQTRILHLDRLIYEPADKGQRSAATPRTLETQLDLLRAAFETKN
jgi:regulator of CtrA degradation